MTAEDVPGSGCLPRFLRWLAAREGDLRSALRAFLAAFFSLLFFERFSTRLSVSKTLIFFHARNTEAHHGACCSRNPRVISFLDSIASNCDFAASSAQRVSDKRKVSHQCDRFPNSRNQTICPVRWRMCAHRPRAQCTRPWTAPTRPSPTYTKCPRLSYRLALFSVCVGSAAVFSHECLTWPSLSHAINILQWGGYGERYLLAWIWLFGQIRPRSLDWADWKGRRQYLCIWIDWLRVDFLLFAFSFCRQGTLAPALPLLTTRRSGAENVGRDWNKNTTLSKNPSKSHIIYRAALVDHWLAEGDVALPRRSILGNASYVTCECRQTLPWIISFRHLQWTS